MNKTVPFKDNYDLIKSINKYSDIILYISAIIVLATFILSNFTDSFKDIIEYVLKANSILIIAFLIMNLIKDCLLFNAGKKKRLDFIDNAFGAFMTTEHSKGYFSNENIQSGIYKMAVNGFENVFFSLNISRKMVVRTLIINIVILFIFLSSAIYGLDNLVVLIIQLTLPAIMLQQIIKLVLLINNLDNVYHKYCSLFNDLKIGNVIECKIPAMISNLIEYETALTWGNVLLSEKIYNELNPLLSKKWEEIKKECEITQ
ncbi:MAG: hypothetical protein IMY72_12470 [Bacteroidetes bacterium]|nr:hypothetical protein [Bacteroidota bacterium]